MWLDGCFFYFRSVVMDGCWWRVGLFFGFSWIMLLIWVMLCLNCMVSNVKDVKMVNMSMLCGILKRLLRLVFGYVKNLSLKINVF